MKNSSIYTTFSAAVAFIGALIYTVLFYFGIIPAPMLFAMTGIVTAFIVLAIFTWTNRPASHSGCDRDLCIIVYTAAAVLFFAVLLLTIPVAISILYTIVTFLLMFSWIFLVIIWAMSLCSGLCSSKDHGSSHRDASSGTYYNNKYNY